MMYQMPIHYTMLKTFAGALLGHQVVLQEFEETVTVNGVYNNNEAV